MRANPGGILKIDEVLGRDALISDLWDTLENQSVVMTAERRIGKTSVIRKMRAEPRDGWIAVLQDLEQYHSAEEFAVSVYKAVAEYLSPRAKAVQVLKKLWEEVGGSEFAGVLKLPPGPEGSWKSLLSRTVESLTAHQADRRLVFFWDEMPYMLDNIGKAQGEAVARQLLDLLRALRQMHPGFRMVLTGSIGLHHVLAELRQEDYRSEPLNDLCQIEVPPLSRPHAEALARELITGEGLVSANLDESAATLAREGDCFPFYIHNIVRSLKRAGSTASPEAVVDCVQEQLVDPNDPWELGHFRSRIPSYYPGQQALVSGVLDVLAHEEGCLDLSELLSAIKAQMPFDDRDGLIAVLRLLERDHYLRRDRQGRYGFRFPLIRRWWRLDRGLA